MPHPELGLHDVSVGARLHGIQLCADDATTRGQSRRTVSARPPSASRSWAPRTSPWQTQRMQRGPGQRVLRRLQVQQGVLGHREAGDLGPRLLRRAHHPHHQGGHVASHSSRSGPAGLPDVLNQINGRKHATTQVAPNLAYSDPEMTKIALRNKRRAKHKVTRPEIMVRIRVKPIESRGSYRVNEIAWSEKVLASVESGRWGQGLAWRGGRKRWRTGIPKTRGQSPQRRL